MQQADTMLDIDAFCANGFARLERAAPREVAEEAQRALWTRIGLSPDHPGDWTEPVVWTADLTGDGPFGILAHSPRLAQALDTVCGVGGWHPRGALGNIPVRFPLAPKSDDRGWHIDLNTPQSDGSWAVSGRPHTLLLLTILSDIGPRDAPTRIRVGSHRNVAAVLDESPIDAVEGGRVVDAASADCDIALATGAPGDMYVVHPLAVHAADEHRGRVPRFMSQAPVLLRDALTPRSPSPLSSVWR